jgi:hypothetical protein
MFTNGAVAGLAVPQTDHRAFESGGFSNTLRPALFTQEAERCAPPTGGTSSYAVCRTIIFWGSNLVHDICQHDDCFDFLLM